MNKSKEELISELFELQQAHKALQASAAADMVTQKQTMEALKESEARFQLLFNKAPLGYQSLDFDGNFLEVNQQWLDTLGYERQEVIGKWFGDFLTLAFQDGFRKRFPIFKELGKIHSEFEMIHKNGSVLFIAFDGRIGYDDKGDFKQTHCILKDITEVKHAEKALIESEEKYRLLHENAGIGIGYYKVDGTIISFNNIAARNMNGVPEDFNGKSIYDFFSKDLAEFYLERIKKAIVSEIPVDYEDEVDLPTGNKYFISTFTRIINANGEIDGVQILSHDITDRRQAEAALKASEEKFSKSFFNSPDSIVINRLDDGKIVSVNNGFRKLMGYEDAEVIGKTTTELNFYKNHEERNAIIDALKKTGQAIDIECLFTTKHGEEKIGLLSAAFIDIDGVKHIISTTRDITHRKKMELLLQVKTEEIEAQNEEYQVINEELNQTNQELLAANKKTEESEERFRKSIEFSPIPMAVTNNKGDILFLNKHFVEAFGYTIEELVSIPKWFELVYPDIEYRSSSLTIWGSDVEFALKNNVPTPLREYFITCKNGVVKTVEISVFFEKNISIGLFQDITERKKAERELTESTERFKSLHNASFGGIAIHDQGKILECNQGLSDMTGYSVDELIGMDGLLLIAPEYREMVMNKIVTGYEKPYEANGLRKNGDQFPIRLEARNVPYKGKNVRTVEFRDITEQKQAEEEIQKQNAYIKMILDNFPIGIATNEIGSSKVTYMNRKFSEIYGWPEEDFPYIENFFEKVFPDLEYREQLQTRIMADISSGDSERMNWDNLRITTKAGDQRIVYAHNIPLLSQNIMVSTVQDITERKQAEEALHNSEAIKNTMVSNIGDVIVIIDQNGINQYKSPNITTLFGWKPEELVGKSTWENVHPDDLNAAQEFIATLAKEPNATETTEIRYKRKDGRYVWIEITIVNLLSDPNIRGFLGNYHDISNRKKAEQDLIIAKVQAEESDRLKSAFLANMSHEIRTPMNGILGFAELLKEPNLTGEQQQEYVKIIEKSGDRMLNIINNIIDISKIEANLMNVDRKECNINEKIEFIYTFFKPQVEEKGMQLHFKTTLPAKEATIRTDNEKVYSILTNLVKNAIKFSVGGTIEFGYIKKNEMLEFFVKDTGIGIPKDRQSVIFERFIQADISDKMARQGAGLGLSISKAYVELLGGKIWVESEEGIGTTFYFTLPYNAFPDEKDRIEKVVHPQANKEQNHSEFSGLKILIAEDDETSEMLISIDVSKFSKTILIAKTGIEAVEECRNNPDIDLILMDIQMPVMNGYEATRQIRLFNSDVVIIAQTAFGIYGDREKAIEAGCNDYITKPIKKEELLSLIHKYFKI